MFKFSAAVLLIGLPAFGYTLGGSPAAAVCWCAAVFLLIVAD